MSITRTLTMRHKLLPRGNLLLRHKLLMVVVATTLAALCVAGVAMILYDLRTYEQALVNDLMVQADILGRASAPAIAFDDTRVAQENLSLLKANSRISGAAVYTAKGGLFATYTRGDSATSSFPNLPDAEGYHVEGKDLVVYKRIVDGKEIVGTVYLKAHYDLIERFKSFFAILSGVLLLSLMVAVLLSSWMHAVVIKPIVAIGDMMRSVVESRDFSVRARKTTTDEIGVLVDCFNDMLSEIGRRAASLEESNQTLAREINERRETEEALLISERRNRTLVAATTSVVWAADGKGCFSEAQASWEAYTGQKHDAYIGTGWRAAFEESDRNRLDLAWARTMTAVEPFELELRLWHEASRVYRYVSLRAVPVLEHRGVAREWIGTVTDIHNERSAERELRELNAELENRVSDRTAELQTANKELESFSYSVSHDLRAPVRAIVGYSRMLWEDHAAQLDEEAQRKLEVIQSEAQRMGALIDDLLAFARLGRQAIKKVELNMQQMAQNMFDRLLRQHQGPAVDFRVGPLPTARADYALIDQVWTNFLSNALKFSAKREHPAIEVGAISDAGEHIYFVRDNGAGFDTRYQSKLFGVFQRLHDAHEFAGTGVGLALVHKIVTRHGGRVWADSKLDEGATFYFTLPKEGANGNN